MRRVKVLEGGWGREICGVFFLDPLEISVPLTSKWWKNQ